MVSRTNLVSIGNLSKEIVKDIVAKRRLEHLVKKHRKRYIESGDISKKSLEKESPLGDEK
jgi:hypothetical protein